jgi:hypothetical protein
MAFQRSASLPRIVAACLPALFAGQIAGADAPAATGSIAVRQTVQCCYREGSVSYVSINQVGNNLITAKVVRPLAGLEPILLAQTEVPAGTYVVSSFQRPCDGNCDLLNAPSDRCDSEPFEVQEGATVSFLVSVVPFGGCSISLEGSYPPGVRPPRK